MRSTSASKFEYVLKPEHFPDGASANAFIDAQVKQAVQAKTPPFTYTRDDRVEGWSQLCKDLVRNLQVNDKPLDEKTKALVAQCKSADTINEILLKELPDAKPEKIKALIQHYSQMPSLFIVPPISMPFANSAIAIEHPDKEEISNVLFFEKGEVYIKVTACNFYVIPEASRYRLFPLATAVEVLFRLDDKNGFALQHISTDSQRVAGIYFGSKKTTTEILNTAVGILGEIDAIKNFIHDEFKKKEADLKKHAKKLEPQPSFLQRMLSKPKDSERKTEETVEKKSEPPKKKTDAKYQRKHAKVTFVTEASLYITQYTENKISFSELKKNLRILTEEQKVHHAGFFKRRFGTLSAAKFTNAIHVHLDKIEEQTSPFLPSPQETIVATAPGISLASTDRA